MITLVESSSSSKFPNVLSQKALFGLPRKIFHRVTEVRCTERPANVLQNNLVKDIKASSHFPFPFPTQLTCNLLLVSGQ